MMAEKDQHARSVTKTEKPTTIGGVVYIHHFYIQDIFTRGIQETDGLASAMIS